jgi:hypothetical protein
MSEELIQSIKSISHKISEDYLLFGKNMNNSIVEAYFNGEIGNNEVLKRICEHANQNVYLGLFNDPSVNKANITFDLADFNQIIPIIRESELSMNDIKTPPEDFRNKLTSRVTTPTHYNETAQEQEDDQMNEAKSVEKQAQLYEVVQYRDVLKNFMDKIAVMKCAEEKVAEESFEKMRHDAKIVVAKGDSIGDLAKIASRNIKEMGGDFVKVAQAYDEIQKELVSNNFHVNTEFTKLSSMKINPNAEILRPVNDFYFSMCKMAGFSEMYESASRTLSIFNKVISSEMKK